jgi:uncharacterized protein YqeY
LTLHDPSDSFSPMSTDLKQQIQTNLITARKARNRLETVVLTTLLSEIRNREIEERDELANADVEAVVSRAIKQRRDASTQMRDGGRPELADKEDAEAEILQAYLPPQLSEADVREIVQKAISGGGDQLGALMGRVMPQVRGRFDGKEANRIVREELG